MCAFGCLPVAQFYITQLLNNLSISCVELLFIIGSIFQCLYVLKGLNLDVRLDKECLTPLYQFSWDLRIFLHRSLYPIMSIRLYSSKYHHASAKMNNRWSANWILESDLCILERKRRRDIYNLNILVRWLLVASSLFCVPLVTFYRVLHAEEK